MCIDLFAKTAVKVGPGYVKFHGHERGSFMRALYGNKRLKMRCFGILGAAFTLMLIPFNLHAQWPTSPDSSLEISQGIWKNAISDGQGGAYIATSDYVGNARCTRVDHGGNIVWGPLDLDAQWGAYLSGHRFPMISLASDSSLIVSCSDVYYYWETEYEAKIRVQKISPLGEKLWGDGIVLTPENASGSTNTRGVFSYSIADNDGGAYVIWGDGRDDIDRMWMQRISPDGHVLWDSLGVLLNIPGRDIRYLKLTSSSQVLVICVNGTTYAQIIDENGGLILNTAHDFGLGNYGYFALDSNDNLFFMNYHERVFKTNLTFDHLWSDSGFAFSDSSDFIFDLIPDQDGGAILQYRKEDITDRNFSQWVNSDGSLKYGISGAFSLISDGSWSPATMSDDSTFIVIHHAGFSSQAHFAQRMDSQGNALWEHPVRTTPSDIYSQQASYAVSDGEGGAIYVYEYNNRIFATQIGYTGTLGSITSIDDPRNLPKRHLLLSLYPNPFNPSTIMEYDLPEYAEVSLIIYDMTGREVNRLVSRPQSPGSYKVSWNGRDHSGREVSGGMYFARLEAGSSFSVIKMVYLR